MKHKILAYKVTKEKLIKALESKGWKTRPWQTRDYADIFTPKGEKISWRILGDRIENTDDYDLSLTVCFYFKDCYLEELDFGTISLCGTKNRDIFMSFYSDEED